MRFAFSFNENQCAKKEEPTTAFLVASAGMGALGAIQQGNAAQAQAEAAAQAADYNRKMAEQEAAAEEARRRRESSREMGAIRAGIAKSGVQSAGTPLMVLAQSAEEAEMDALSAKWQGQTSADLYRMEAASARQRGKAAKQAIPFNVGSSLLSSYATYKSIS